MTMLSLRVDDELAREIRAWADELGVDRSELLRDAIRRELKRLRAEEDARRWEEQPLTDEERAFMDVSDWGPAEDWSDLVAWLDERDRTPS